MKAIFSFLVLACPMLQVQAQIEWQRCYGDTAIEVCNAIRQTFDSGYILAGYSSGNGDDVSGNHGGADFWVVKISAIGAIQWQMCYGGSNDDEAYDIQQTADSGYIITGYTSSNDDDVSGNHGGEDVWVIKISVTGGLQWQKCLGGSGDDIARGIGLTNDGGYIVAATTNSNDGNVSGNHGEEDYWVIKLTDTGSITWAKCYGGSNPDVPLSIQQCFDGGYFVGGSSSSDDGDVTGHIGGTSAINLWVVKLATNGNIEWEEPLAGSYADYSCGEEGGVTIQTNDSGYIVGGLTCATGGEVTGYTAADMYDLGDGWMVKLAKNGTIQWDRCIYISGNDYIRAIQQTADNGYIFAGADQHYMANSNALFGKLSDSGNIEWLDTLGGSSGSSTFYSVALTNDGLGIAAGYTSADNGDVSGNFGSSNYWVVKFGLPERVTNSQKTNFFTIAPNPAIQYILVSATGIIYSIVINNTVGQQVFNSKYDADKVSVDVSAFPPGMYFVKINGMETSKFVKE